MTDRELLDILLSHLNNQTIHCNQSDYVEIQNVCFGEDIAFEFDKKGNIIKIYC